MILKKWRAREGLRIYVQINFSHSNDWLTRISLNIDRLIQNMINEIQFMGHSSKKYNIIHFIEHCACVCVCVYVCVCFIIFFSLENFPTERKHFPTCIDNYYLAYFLHNFQSCSPIPVALQGGEGGGGGATGAHPLKILIDFVIIIF